MQRIGIVVAAISFFVAVSASTSSATQASDTQGLSRRAPASVEYAIAGRPLIAVSHRGAAGHAPENTLASFDTARRLGAETVEIDVQRTQDDALVLLHDTDLARTTDVEEVFPSRSPYRVSDFTLAEIQRLDAGSWFSSAFEDEAVPTLGEALDRLEELGLNLFLELKEPGLYAGIEQEIADELAGHGYWLETNQAWEPRRFVVQSFDWAAVRRSKDLLPSVPHALLGRVPEDRISEFAWADMINPNHTTIDAAYVNRVQGEGLETMPYTVNERSSMDAVLELGADGFITDFPDIGQQAITDYNKGSRPIIRIATPQFPAFH